VRGQGLRGPLLQCERPSSAHPPRRSLGALPEGRLPPVLTLAISDALKSTLGLGVTFGVAFPLLVQGLIVYAVMQARGERAANEERRRSRRR